MSNLRECYKRQIILLLMLQICGCAMTGTDGRTTNSVTSGAVGNDNLTFSEVNASRIFAGSEQYPPEDFKAFGIVAFPSRASESTRSRHLMICNAYISTLLHTNEMPDIQRSSQMVTVWPIQKDSVANVLNQNPVGRNTCEGAVDNYGLRAAQKAIKEAKFADEKQSLVGNLTGLSTTSRGPFLLAWSPAKSKGNRSALVLFLNLSSVTQYDQAREIFQRWAQKIEKKPELWSNGWDWDSVIHEIRLWVDDTGVNILGAFSYD